MWIRKIRKIDYAAVDRLLLQLHQVDVEGRPDLFAPADHYMAQEAFETLLENENVLAFLVQERLTVLGCCFVSLLERCGEAPQKTAYIDLLVVDQAHRRPGIGRMIFQEVERQARALGAQKVELTAWNHNTAALCASESYGMQPQRSIYEIRL